MYHSHVRAVRDAVAGRSWNLIIHCEYLYNIWLAKSMDLLYLPLRLDPASYGYSGKFYT